MNKFDRILSTAALTAVILGMLALAINQGTRFAIDLIESQNQTVSAAQACADYMAIGSMTNSEGETLCWTIYQGSASVMPLEKLQEMYAK
jgi:hypothetical protein